MQERRMGGSGILMPDQEPHTRFRIVRMSSGLGLAEPSQHSSEDEQMITEPEEGQAAEDSDDEDRNPRHSAVEVRAASVASIVIRYRRDQQVEADQNLVEEVQQPSTSSASRTFVILGSNAQNTSRYRYSRYAGSRIKVPKNHKIHQNVPRLSHFIEEPNVGRGFIKELCFSSDGRLICSPFGHGVRLLAFSSACSELSSCVPKEGPVRLHELGANICHEDTVVSTKFSPRHCLLVSGCLTGRIVWHQPIV